MLAKLWTTSAANRRDDDRFIIENNHPAIIGRADVRAVQRRLVQHGRRDHAARRRRRLPVDGTVTVREVWWSMHGDDGGNHRYRARIQSNAVTCDGNARAQDEVLDNVLAAIEERFCDPTVWNGCGTYWWRKSHEGEAWTLPTCKSGWRSWTPTRQSTQEHGTGRRRRPAT